MNVANLKENSLVLSLHLNAAKDFIVIHLSEDVLELVIRIETCLIRFKQQDSFKINRFSFPIFFLET